MPELQRDCPNLYVCQDFMRLVACWQAAPHALPLFAKAAIRVAHLPVAATEPAATVPGELPAGKAGQAVLRSVAASEVRFRINVKLALFSGVDIAESALFEKEEASLNHFIQFLVLKAVNKDQIFLVGGQFGLVADLRSVSDAMLIAKLMSFFPLFLTFREYARSQINLDLAGCRRWIRMMEVWYHRTETSRGEKCDYDEVTVVFVPDLFYRAPVFPAVRRPIAKDRKDGLPAERKTAGIEEVKKETPNEIVEVGEIVRASKTAEVQETGETGETEETSGAGENGETGETGEAEKKMEETVETVETVEPAMEEESEKPEKSEKSEKPEWTEEFLKSQTVPTLRQFLRERALSTRVPRSARI